MHQGCVCLCSKGITNRRPWRPVKHLYPEQPPNSVNPCGHSKLSPSPTADSPTSSPLGREAAGRPLLLGPGLPSLLNSVMLTDMASETVSQVEEGRTVAWSAQQKALPSPPLCCLSPVAPWLELDDKGCHAGSTFPVLAQSLDSKVEEELPGDEEMRSRPSLVVAYINRDASLF